ncbi:MAG: DUF523 domain-containing protein [Alphaproteobacteria bacterium]|jgi:uncharacterized protein YbbK (DUF523 family)
MKILISACLLGEKVRYDGKDNFLSHPVLKNLYDKGHFVVICPEVAGGLPIPRPPAERQHTGQVLTRMQEDVTEAFTVGARRALALAKENNCKLAILKARSPSCGNKEIYDGTFSKTLVPGMGVTAELLTQNGVTVFNEEEIDQAIAFYETLTKEV